MKISFQQSILISQHVRRMTTTSASLSPRQVAFRDLLREQLAAVEAQGTWKHERLLTGQQRSKINVLKTPASAGGVVSGKLLNFCANNYLGLADHPDCVDAAIQQLRTHGAGLASVRFICGTQDIHKELESIISRFHAKEDAILYASCFDANAGVFEALLTEQDAVISDALNHASIIDGIRLCKAKRYRYQNNNMQDLETQLKRAHDEQGARVKLIATDGVFSMDGSIAKLDQICNLADKYNALVFVDECHATGFVGKLGRGTPELFQVMDRVDIINSTLGKAMGGAMGGYTTASREVVNMLRQKSRPYLFSNSLPPSVVATARAAFSVVHSEEGTRLRKQLTQNTQLFRRLMTEAGFKLKGGDQTAPDAYQHPICPVMLGDARLASTMADELLQLGIYVIGFSYPVVPRGEARIRVQLSAAHTRQDIEKCVHAFIEVGRRHGVI